MRLYVAVHGQIKRGVPNPGHTQEGIMQILDLQSNKVSEIYGQIVEIWFGSGGRFHELFHLLFPDPAVPFFCSPLLGGAESLNEKGDVLLASGRTIPKENYVGIKKIAGFDPWKFLESLPNGVFLCSGGELMKAFGFEKEHASLYQIDVEQRTCRKL